MKKIFAILVLAFILNACNNGSKETSANTIDSLRASESPVMDAVNTADSASKIMHDSTGMMIEIDSMLKK